MSPHDALLHVLDDLLFLRLFFDWANAVEGTINWMRLVRSSCGIFSTGCTSTGCTRVKSLSLDTLPTPLLLDTLPTPVKALSCDTLLLHDTLLLYDVCGATEFASRKCQFLLLHDPTPMKARRLLRNEDSMLSSPSVKFVGSSHSMASPPMSPMSSPISSRGFGVDSVTSR